MKIFSRKKLDSSTSKKIESTPEEKVAKRRKYLESTGNYNLLTLDTTDILLESTNDEEFKIVVENYRKTQSYTAIILHTENIKTFDNKASIVKVKIFDLSKGNGDPLREEVLLLDENKIVRASANITNVGCIQDNCFVLNRVPYSNEESTNQSPYYSAKNSSNQPFGKAFYSGTMIIDSNTGLVKMMQDTYNFEFERNGEKHFIGETKSCCLTLRYFFDINGKALKEEPEIVYNFYDGESIYDFVDRTNLRTREDCKGYYHPPLDVFKFSAKDFFRFSKGKLCVNETVEFDFTSQGQTDISTSIVRDKNNKPCLCLETDRYGRITPVYDQDGEVIEDCIEDAYCNRLYMKEKRLFDKNQRLRQVIKFDKSGNIISTEKFGAKDKQASK